MEVDMDSDLDKDIAFGNDRIHFFLLSQEEAIQNNNKNLENMIARRCQLLSQLEQSKCAVNENEHPSVCFYWKQFFSDQCFLCFKVVNHVNTNTSINICKIFLSMGWLPSTNYNIFIMKESAGIMKCNENCIKTIHENLEINEKGYILLSFKTPQFIDDISFNVTGNILCNVGNEEISLEIPSVEVNLSDLTNRKLYSFPHVKTENPAQFCSSISCNNSNFIFKIILPKDFTTKIEDLNDIYFSKATNAMCMCKKYYFYNKNKVSLSFEYALLEVQTRLQDTELTVYCKTDDISLKFLHYLYQNIISVLLIPNCCHQINVDLFLEEFHIQKEMHESLLLFNKEIDIVHSYIQYLNSTRNDCVLCRKLRFRLMISERNTDFNYLRISKQFVSAPNQIQLNCQYLSQH